MNAVLLELVPLIWCWPLEWVSASSALDCIVLEENFTAPALFSSSCSGVLLHAWVLQRQGNIKMYQCLDQFPKHRYIYIYRKYSIGDEWNRERRSWKRTTCLFQSTEHFSSRHENQSQQPGQDLNLWLFFMPLSKGLLWFLFCFVLLAFHNHLALCNFGSRFRRNIKIERGNCILNLHSFA